MSLTIADQFYLKALDNYPWDLESSIENLNYALGYDDHAQTNCLMGRLYMDYLKDYHLASEYFQQALLVDMYFIDTYKYFSLLKIWLGDYIGAKKLIQYGLKLKGMNPVILRSRMALIYECQGQLPLAKQSLRQAMMECLCEEQSAEIFQQLSRIKRKIKMQKAQVKLAKKSRK